jgi:hypothetical protein
MTLGDRAKQFCPSPDETIAPRPHFAASRGVHLILSGLFFYGTLMPSRAHIARVSITPVIRLTSLIATSGSIFSLLNPSATSDFRCFPPLAICLGLGLLDGTAISISKSGNQLTWRSAYPVYTADSGNGSTRPERGVKLWVCSLV